ncbi:MAG: hypothetical protein HYW63_00775 [Candidatus Levybacteria bacterium]|nr:hypothetical protein [Candidatus Levybacteria bacterium]
MTKEIGNSSILEELHEEEEELHRDEKRVAVAFAIISIIILISLAGIFYLILQSKKSHEPATIINATPSISQEPTATPSPTPTPKPVTTEVNKKTDSKEYYINIGSGTNQSLDWADVGGALTTADIAAYENIKEVHFEAFINVPTANGKVSVRLFNKTDNYAVWNSEVTRDGTKDTYQFISPALIYDRGPRLYQVQMKSQLNVLANLVSSRIRIITE